MIQRTLEYMFTSTDRQLRLGAGSLQIEIKASYLEIYNETLMDLINPNQSGLKLREDVKNGGIICENLTEASIENAEQAQRVFIDGTKNRRRAATAMNKESSRSHIIFTLIVKTTETKTDGLVKHKTGRLHMVDLAGSERQKNTKATGDRLKEANAINVSLLTLGRVISALVDVSRGLDRHVHFRDSKLTWFLKESLGGNSKTVFIANVGPSEQSFGETLGTLKFAAHCKSIKNKPKCNEDASGSFSDLQAEIRRLRDQVTSLETENRIAKRKSFSPRRNRLSLASLSPKRSESTSAEQRALTMAHVAEQEVYNP